MRRRSGIDVSLSLRVAAAEALSSTARRLRQPPLSRPTACIASFPPLLDLISSNVPLASTRSDGRVLDVGPATER